LWLLSRFGTLSSFLLVYCLLIGLLAFSLHSSKLFPTGISELHFAKGKLILLLSCIKQFGDFQYFSR
jgi:hypothetical protein